MTSRLVAEDEMLSAGADQSAVASGAVTATSAYPAQVTGTLALSGLQAASRDAQLAAKVLEQELLAPQAIPPEEPKKWKFRSTFILAVAFFVAVNALMSFSSPFPFDSYKFNYRGWSWWTFNALRNSDRISNIAIIGSSTMVSAIAGCDANFLHRGLDLTEHHRASYLEDKLTRKFPAGQFETFSLAAPGQMPSDAYISLKAMVATASRPDIVIYGLAPRDFVDSTLSAPGDTDTFRYLTRIVNIDDVFQKVFRSPFGKLDWCLQRLIYVYGNSLDFRMGLTEGATAFVNRVLPRPWSKTPFTWWDRRDVLPNYLPAEIHPAAVMAAPIDLAAARDRYTDNTAEYLQRYKHPDPHTYRTQMYFLAKIAEFCRKERIELVLVNMPITRQNISMLREGGDTEYRQKLKEFSMLHDVEYCDLNNFARYDQGDFHDSVHLNAFGGQKFFDDVCGFISQDHKLNSVVAMAGEHLARHRALAAEPGKRALADRLHATGKDVPF